MKAEDINITVIPKKHKSKPVPKTGQKRYKHNKHKCDYCIEGMLHKFKRDEYFAKKEILIYN